MKTAVETYYHNLAPKYNEDRFGNSYGQYLDRQEKSVMRALLHRENPEKTLDMGCGTGRFLEFAAYGVDISPAMLAIARDKYPDKQLFVESATQTHFADGQFDVVLSFHLIMHLDRPTTSAIWEEAYRLLPPGGWFIFDIPSEKRRRLTGYKAPDWHGANAISLHDVVRMTREKWKVQRYFGVAFLPVHRIPEILRKPAMYLDNLLCRSFLREYASYIIIALQKQ